MQLPDPRKMTDGEIVRLEHQLWSWQQATGAIVRARYARRQHCETTAQVYDQSTIKHLRDAGVEIAPFGWESVEGETPAEGLKLAGLLAG